MKPSAIVFDIGGVLLDIDWKRVVKALNLESDKRYIEWIRHWPLHHHYEKGLQKSESFFTQLRDYWKLEYDIDFIEKAWNKIFKGPVKGIQKVIDTLPPKLPKYILSNTNESHIKYCLEHYSLLQQFDRCFFSYEWQARKPEPQFYLAMLKEIKLQPQSVLFLDDGIENIQAARELGMMAELTVHSSEQTQAILDQYFR